MQSKNLVMIIAAVFIIAVLAGATYVYAFAASPATVANGDNVSVYYKLTLTNGTLLQTNFGQQPFNFTVGANQVITGFDQAVIGMQVNQTKNVTLAPDEAYGDINPALFVTVPISVFGNHTVQDGMPIVRTDNTTGEQMEGTVTSVNATNATIDFNPPLAGQTLIFEIKVAGIRK